MANGDPRGGPEEIKSKINYRNGIERGGERGEVELEGEDSWRRGGDGGGVSLGGPAEQGMME